MRVLDWDVLKDFVENRHPVEVSAGILNDWYWTADTVYENGSFRADHGAFVESYWATPGFKAKMPNGDVIEVVAYKEK